jgi:cytochrome c556
VKIFHKSIVTVACIAFFGLGALAHAAEADDALKRAKKIEKLRGSAMYLQAWSLGPMAGMVKGQIPYDAAAFNTSAKRLSALAEMVEDLFREDLRSFALDTEAKPEIWDEYAEFSRLAGNLMDSSAKLAVVSAGGDLEASGKALTAVADDCKACHDKYKVDDH